MNVSEIFIRRPVMTTLLMLAAVLFGVMGYRQLPVSDLPNVDFPTIQVRAELPGANPETMASAVATPLEKQFSTIAGIDSMYSVSGQGVSQITLQFSLDRDIDAAAQDVNSAIAATARQLPSTMPAPPALRKVNPGDFAVFYLALTSETMPLSTVDEYAETFLAQRISTIGGVAQVQVFVNPLLAWLWIGGAIYIVGGLIAFAPARAASTVRDEAAAPAAARALTNGKSWNDS